MLEERVSGPGRRDLLRSRQDRLQVAELPDEGGRGLLPDAGHAGDVVGCVAEQREEIGHALGGHAEPLLGVVRRHPHLFHSGRSAAARIQQRGVIVHELMEILVSRDDDGAQTLARGLLREGPDDVVRLPPFGLDDGHPEGVEDLPAPGERGPEFVGHLLSRGLVLRVDVRAEAVAGIERDAEIVGCVIADQPHEEAGDSVGGRSVLATRGGERPVDHGEERAVDERVAIEQEERRASRPVEGFTTPGRRHTGGHGLSGLVNMASSMVGGPLAGKARRPRKAPRRVGRGA